MSGTNNPQPQSRLEEILDKVWLSNGGYADLTLKSRLIAALTTYIEDEIIGPDENLYRNSVGALLNDLRAEQRKRLRGNKDE